MVSFHPPQGFLDSYAAGNLSSPSALAVNVHLRHCPQCAKNVKQLEHIGGDLMDDLLDSVESNAPAHGDRMAELRERVMNHVGTAEKGATPVTVLGAGTARTAAVNKPASSPSPKRLLPQYLNHEARTRYAGLAWQNLTRSIQTAALGVNDNGAHAELMDISPGASIWRHYHTGDEITVVLDGSFSDENGVYKPGDFLLRSGKQAHKPVGTRDASCMCLIVHEGPAQFASPWLAWLNPFFRFYYRNYQGKLAANPVPISA